MNTFPFERDGLVLTHCTFPSCKTEILVKPQHAGAASRAVCLQHIRVKVGARAIPRSQIPQPKTRGARVVVREKLPCRNAPECSNLRAARSISGYCQPCGNRIAIAKRLKKH